MEVVEMNKCQSLDPAVRPAQESDIPYIIELFKRNYPGFYPHPELYDETWLKYAINSDNVILRVIDEQEEVVAFGAVFLDYGDYNNQLGLIGGMVAHPERANVGVERGLGRLGNRIINHLVCAGRDKIECVISEARTVHRLSQRFLERADLIAAGFLPHYNLINEKYESLVLYTSLYGEARKRRSECLPQVITEVASLAYHVLTAMSLPTALDIVNDCPPYSDKFTGELQPEDRDSLAQLRRIDRERSGDPVLFDSVSLDYGLPVRDGKRVSYRKAMESQQLVGGIGYRVDAENQIFKMTDLAFNRSDVINYLCAEAIHIAQQQGARIIEADLSAYDARIQQTFLSYGFHPAAYIPAMALHNNYRLDIVKMIKLEVPYDSSGMLLYEKAKQIVPLVESAFNSAPIQSI
jgi:hypothetical protein